MTSEKIGIIIGTNRQNSLSGKVAHYYKKQLEFKGASAEVIDLSKLPEDFAFSALYQNAGHNVDFNEFQVTIDRIQKFVVVVPEYNGSFPGVLKTFFDGLRYPDTFDDKKVALVGISAGVLGNAVGLGHLNDILSYMGANVLGLRVKLGLTGKHFKDDDFTLPIYKEFIDKQIKQLIAF
jgi:NAD(P)H-dependent FMN reductase